LLLVVIVCVVAWHFWHAFEDSASNTKFPHEEWEQIHRQNMRRHKMKTMSKAQACLGDTFEFMSNSLGNPVSTDGNMSTFQNGPWTVIAHFDENQICQAIDYVKLDRLPITRAPQGPGRSPFCNRWLGR
jgi:hypothetical protein